MKLFKRLAVAFKSRNERAESQYPSVNAYETLEKLGAVLASHEEMSDEVSLPASRRGSARSNGSDDFADKTKKTMKKKKETVGWKLTIYDKASSEPQTMEEELRRLQVLQSYFVLDSEGEEDFDLITNLASSMFKTKYAVVSLVDLGRQWFLSKVGLETIETPRNISFCAHVIISKHNVFVVRDALEDFRFKNSPLVTEGQKTRFYAGATLVSPEGYKLGTLCVADTSPRPDGFSESDQQKLLALSKLVMSSLVARRNRLLLSKAKEILEDAGESFLSASKTLSSAARSTEAYVLTDGKDRDTADLVSTVHKLRLQEKLCMTVARTLLEKEEKSSYEKTEPALDGWVNDALSRYADLSDEPTTDIQKLFDNINTVLNSLRCMVSVTVEVEAGVPNQVSGDDLLLFRSALNLLMHGINRSENGSVHLRISCHGQANLLFQCEDSGELIPYEKVAETWKHQLAFLFPIRSMVRSVGGSCGTRQGRLDCMEAPPKPIFWFKTPNDVESAGHEKFNEGVKIVHEVRERKGESTDDRLVVDPFAAALLEESCINMERFNQSKTQTRSGSLVPSPVMI